MTAKERMIYALSDMLQNGEKLMHPIYGLLVQGGRQYYGYFGFTEKFLLIALISGKTVTDTIRVPLDINSVKINPSIIMDIFVQIKFIFFLLQIKNTFILLTLLKLVIIDFVFAVVLILKKKLLLVGVDSIDISLKSMLINAITLSIMMVLADI